MKNQILIRADTQKHALPVHSQKERGESAFSALVMTGMFFYFTAGF